MELKNLSDEELAAALNQLQTSSEAGAKAADQLQASMHELHVYRMELEMQNRALRETQAELESAIRRQNDLYDFSPIGYLTLSRTGMIDDANLTAAELLQVERTQLRSQRFGRFLDASDNQRFVSHLNDARPGRASVLSVTLRRPLPHPALVVQLSSRLGPQAEG